jgi:hypothetical protein
MRRNSLKLTTPSPSHVGHLQCTHGSRVPMAPSPFAKEHRARAPARAWSRASGLRQLRLPAILVFKPRVKSSSQSRVLCSFVLQHLQELVAAAAEQSRTNGAMLSERPARVLLMLARCTRSASAPVRLPQPPIRRTRPRSSPNTCWHLMRKREAERLSDHRQSRDQSAMVVRRKW